jgi:hypothetical protein
MHAHADLAQKYSVGLQEIFVSRLCSQEEHFFPALRTELAVDEWEFRAKIYIHYSNFLRISAIFGWQLILVNQCRQLKQYEKHFFKIN